MISFEGGPLGNGGELSPVYNPLLYYFSSTNVAEPGFRYVVEVLNSDTSELLASLEIPPRPSDDFCVADIGKILSNYVTAQLPTDTWAIEATNSFIRYDINVKERYFVEYAWTGYAQASGAVNFPQYTQLQFSSATPFAVGDQIINSQTDPTDEPLLEGILTVIEVIDPQTIVVNRQWSILTGGTGSTGTSVYADGRKFTSASLLNINDKIAWNGALSHVDFYSYVYTQYQLNGFFLGKALSSIPTTFTVTEESVILLNFWNNIIANRRLYITDGVTTKFRDLASVNKEVIAIPVGPGNIDEASFTLDSGPAATLTSGGAIQYDFYVADNAGVPLSRTYTFVLDYTCTDWDRYQLVFMDRLGSLSSFSFYYLNQNTQNIQRSQNTFQIGDVNTTSNEWEFATTDAAIKLSNVTVNSNLQLNTAWLTQDESRYMQELFSSPLVWINIGNNFFPVVVTDSSSTTRDIRTNKNIRYTINVQFANRETINW